MELIKNYIDCFSKKDLLGISALLDDDMCLIEWSRTVSGKIAVLDAYKEIFSTDEDISVVIEHCVKDGLTYFLQLKIRFGSGADIKVVDVITYNDVNKIIEISAYRQF